MTSEARFSLEELVDLAGVQPRQIRELIRLGIVPPPSSGGRGATYGADHLDRLRAWKVLREQAPAKTTNEQLRVALNRLSAQGVLRSIAEGKTPVVMFDDDKEDVTLDRIAGSLLPTAGLVARMSQGEGTTNEEALKYLANLPRGSARVAMSKLSREPRVEVPLTKEGSSTVPMERLRDALEQYVSDHASEVRVKPPRTETWQRVNISGDLEISARGPLSPDEIQLLETIGQLLQQAIYRKERP
jgi:DNA-binding transcriptional MerR regulator